jgi:hypothetical protein
LEGMKKKSFYIVNERMTLIKRDNILMFVWNFNLISFELVARHDLTNDYNLQILKIITGDYCTALKFFF